MGISYACSSTNEQNQTDMVQIDYSQNKQIQIYNKAQSL